MGRLMPPGARFTRRGMAQVAGTACMEWEVTVPQGQTMICLTENGVMLRSVAGTGEDSYRMEATSVQYNPLPALFVVPQGYRERP